MIEVEMLAVVWGTRKYRMYLQGLPDYDVVVDHKPLVPILNEKSLADIQNPRLLRMKEKLMAYSFRTSWIKGNHNGIPDALSRSPVDQPDNEDFTFEKEITAIAIAQVRAVAIDVSESPIDPLLEDLKRECTKDNAYQQLIDVVSTGYPKEIRDNPYLASFQKTKDQLSVVDGLVMLDSRIVIPTQAK